MIPQKSAKTQRSATAIVLEARQLRLAGFRLILHSRKTDTGPRHVAIAKALRSPCSCDVRYGFRVSQNGCARLQRYPGRWPPAGPGAGRRPRRCRPRPTRSGQPDRASRAILASIMNSLSFTLCPASPSGQNRSPGARGRRIKASPTASASRKAVHGSTPARWSSGASSAPQPLHDHLPPAADLRHPGRSAGCSGSLSCGRSTCQGAPSPATRSES